MSRQVPTEHFTYANGIRIRYLDFPGESGRPPIVLLHNNRGAADPWRRYAEVTRLTNRLIAPDQRGCGSTDKPETGYSVWDLAADVAGLIERLDLGKLPIVGCAIGGSIGLAVAANYPQLVSSLVLLDSGFPIEQEIIDRSVAVLRDTPQGFASREEAYSFVQKLPFSLGYSWTPILREYFDWTFEERPDGRWTFRYDKDAMIQATSHLSDDLWPDVARIQCPTLVAVAGDSGIVAGTGASDLAKAIPNGHFHVLEDIRHLVFLEGDLDPVDRVVVDFLRANDPEAVK